MIRRRAPRAVAARCRPRPDGSKAPRRAAPAPCRRVRRRRRARVHSAAAPGGWPRAARPRPGCRSRRARRRRTAARFPSARRAPGRRDGSARSRPLRRGAFRRGDRARPWPRRREDASASVDCWLRGAPASPARRTAPASAERGSRGGWSRSPGRLDRDRKHRHWPGRRAPASRPARRRTALTNPAAPLWLRRSASSTASLTMACAGTRSRKRSW